MGLLTCAQSLRYVWLFTTQWTIALQCSSVHTIFQPRILEWIFISYSREVGTDMNLGNLQKTVRDREAWYASVHGVAKGWIQLDDWTTTKTPRDHPNSGIQLESPEYLALAGRFLTLCHLSIKCLKIIIWVIYVKDNIISSYPHKE